MILLLSFTLNAQSNLAYKTSAIQLGIVPGLSTNGIDPGEYYNLISINVFTGYGRSTKYFELNGLGGFNTHSSSGIHISGISNFIGGNGQVGKTDNEKEKTEGIAYTPELHGFQLSGLINYVGYNTIGSQISLGFNSTKNYLLGVQMGGILNSVGSFTSGAQFALGVNLTKKSMSGTQASLLFNSSGGRHSGFQLSTINHTGEIGNPKGTAEGTGTSMQLGLINICGNMGGFQVGLINIGDRVGGTQIGLFNFFKNEKVGNFSDGPAYGLLNFGYFIHPKIYMSDLFLSNFGINTGKPLNSRVSDAKRNFYSYNELVYSRNYGTNNGMIWGLSYRAGIISYHKDIGPENRKNYYSISGEVGHVNPNLETDNILNLRYAIHFETGFRLPPRLNSIYPFIGVSFNYMPIYYGNFIEVSKSSTNESRLWPGLSIGVMLY
ncbi:MAG: hypothetical protein RLO81_08160 [Fulvivirga sp.]|uniref:LA_2272 family surface repeat-containing protein n=1 Tax=Fulvivirga sp. TaxID=1931237 RepID=UPI0032EEA04D